MPHDGARVLVDPVHIATYDIERNIHKYRLYGNHIRGDVYLELQYDITYVPHLNLYYNEQPIPQVAFQNYLDLTYESNSLDTTFIYPLIGREPEVWVSKNKIHTKFFPTGTINVFNIRGKLISHNSFDISNIPPGVYYIELLNEIDRWTFQFTKY